MSAPSVGAILERQPALVLDGASLRVLVGYIESIAQAVGLPGLVVDLDAPRSGLELALEEIEDRVLSVKAGRS